MHFLETKFQSILETKEKNVLFIEKLIRWTIKGIQDAKKKLPISF